MKRLLATFCILVLMFSLYACSNTRVRHGQEVTLNFVYEYTGANIHVTLTEEEAAAVIDILNGNAYDSTFLIGYPSCGFNKNIGFQIGSRIFAIACDGCNGFQDSRNYMFFDISKEDMEYIHSLFEKYGGFFPCI